MKGRVESKNPISMLQFNAWVWWSEANRMNVDRDDDIGPGCYVLASTNLLPKRSGFVLKTPRCTNFTKNAMIFACPISIGRHQPGIGRPFVFVSSTFNWHDIPKKGKSVWIYYAKRYHLFIDTGVFVVTKEVDSTYFKPFVWTLVDGWVSRRCYATSRSLCHFRNLGWWPPSNIYSQPLSIANVGRVAQYHDLHKAFKSPLTEKEILQAWASL